MSYKINGNVVLQKSGQSTGNVTKLHAQWSLIDEINNPAPDGNASNSDFGLKMAVDENILVIGSYLESFGAQSQSGRTFLYDLNTKTFIRSIANTNIQTTSTYDSFGQRVAIQGNYIAIGAPFEDFGATTNNGVAYLYDVDGNLLGVYPGLGSNDRIGTGVGISGNFILAGGNLGREVIIHDANSGEIVRRIVSPGSLGDNFGDVIAVAGDKVVIGAPGENSNRGRAYIYNFLSKQLLYTLNNPDGSATNQYYGEDVAIFGDYCIVGARQLGNGTAYVYNVNTGGLVYTVNNPTSTSGEQFGQTVSINDRYFAVGAPRWNFERGRAYIYDLSTGSLVQTYDNPNSQTNATNDRFGEKVLLSENRFITCAIEEEDPTGSPANAGRIYVYALEDIYKISDAETYDGVSVGNSFLSHLYDRGDLLHILTNPDPSPNGDYFAGVEDGITITGDHAIVAANRNDPGSGTDTGSLYIFNLRTGELVHTIDNPDTTSAGSNFGIAIHADKNLLIVGSINDSGGNVAAGIVYIYDINSAELLITIQNPDSSPAGDQFGYNVRISKTGKYAVIGSTREDSTPGGVDNVGTVYIFDIDIPSRTSTLKFTIDNPEVGAGANSYFGFDFDTSGNILVIGNKNADDPNPSAGVVYVYDVYNGILMYTLLNPDSVSTADYFGESVAVSNGYIAVASPSEDDLPTAGGVVYIYNSLNGELLHTVSNPNAQYTPSGDNFGLSLSADGDILVAGAPYEEGPNLESSAGMAYIIQLSTGQVLHTLYNPNIYGTTASDFFGFGVAVSGNRCLVSSSLEDSAAGTVGAVYTYAVNDVNALDLSYDEVKYGI